jgi:hypothetical protein
VDLLWEILMGRKKKSPSLQRRGFDNFKSSEN